MKTLIDYLTTTEEKYSNPVTGDDFAIEIGDECLLETYVVDVNDDKIIVEADERMMYLLEKHGLVGEDTDKLSIGQQMARDGITYSPANEKKIIGMIGDYMKKNGFNEKQIRYYMSYDEDFIPDVLSELPREGVAEGDLETASKDPVVVVSDTGGKILDKLNLSVAAQKYGLGNPNTIKQQLAHQDFTKIKNYTISAPMTGQPATEDNQGIHEGSLKNAMHNDAEHMELKDFLAKWAKAPEDEEWVTEFWKNINEGVAGRPMDEEIKRYGAVGSSRHMGYTVNEANAKASCGCGPECSHCGGKHTMDEVGKTCKCCGNTIKEITAESKGPHDARWVDASERAERLYNLHRRLGNDEKAEYWRKEIKKLYNQEDTSDKQTSEIANERCDMSEPQEPSHQLIDLDRILSLAGQHRVKEDQPIAQAQDADANDPLAAKSADLAAVGAMQDPKTATTIDEGVMSDIDIDLRHIAKTQHMDALVNALRGEFGIQIQQYLQGMMDDVEHDLDRRGMRQTDTMTKLKILLDQLREMYDERDEMLGEAEYQGRKVPLGKPMRGDVKKFKVYVKNPQGNVVKVNFGHGGTSAKRAGQKTMKIKKSNPARRKSFRARHNCDNPGPRHKARYWSCRAW